jgi:hypothetical protein
LGQDPAKAAAALMREFSELEKGSGVPRRRKEKR